MKEYLSLLADYNAHVNREVYGIVAKLPEADRMKDVGSFHKSLFGVLSHIYGSDLSWLRRFNEYVGPFKALAIPELEGPLPKPGVPVFADFESLRAKRPVVDASIKQFVAEISEPSLAKVFSYTNPMGQRFTIAFGQGLLHFFNHQTHHRGAASEILDEMKVANDYSGIVNMLNAPARA